ncbi:MAG TPA: DUF4142 domain-containing protein [Acidobacteriaceae bacterium]|nr:DUF4142 domain-containing protein [Acidobacteriaceae bacterium]
MKQLLLRTFMVSGAIMLSGAMVMAQQQPSNGGMRTPQQNPNPGLNSPQTQQQGSMQQDPSMQKMQDRDFVRKAMQGSMAEVQLGQLAEQKSSSQDVKQFAQKMTQDHSQLDNEMKPIAQQMGVKTPDKISKKDEKLNAKLQNMSGKDFNDTYIKAMVKDHESDLSAFRQEAQTTQNPQLKQAAEQGAQVIEQHLAMIKQIAKNHGVKA